ncbi:alpha-amylase family glycosyl hydrolase, partial [Streptococcus suis]
YECFASCYYMPKWNTSNAEVRKHLIDIGLYWIKEANIDGWRLDVSDEVSHQFWRQFRLAIKDVKQDCVLIGENWHDAYPYLMGDQYDS